MIILVLIVHIVVFWALFLYYLAKFRSAESEASTLRDQLGAAEGDHFDPDDPCDHCSTFGRADGLNQCTFCGMTFKPFDPAGTTTTGITYTVDSSRPCEWCDGTGKGGRWVCEVCNGSGSYTVATQ